MACAEVHFEYQGYCCWSDGETHKITDLATGRVVLERCCGGPYPAWVAEVEGIRRRQEHYDAEEVVFRGSEEL